MGIALQTVEYNDNGGGSDYISSATKGEENISTENLNVDYSVDGAFGTRYGSTILNKGYQLSTDKKILRFFDYRKSDGTIVQIVCAGTSIYSGLTNPTSLYSGLSAALPRPDLEFVVTNDDEYLLWGNGIDTNLKFDGTNWTNLSIAQPAALTLDSTSTGVLPPADYDYYVSFTRRTSGTIVQESELSPIFTYSYTGDFDSGTATSGTVNDLTDTAKVLFTNTATGGGTNYLTDTTIYLATNSFVGKKINITAGTGAGQTNEILSNSDNTFTVVDNWGIAPDATSVYEVSEWGTDQWAGKVVYISAGTGVGQSVTIASNTGDVLTFSAPVVTAPDSTSEFQINGCSITLTVPVSTDSQVDSRTIYRKKIATGVVCRLTDSATITDNTTTTYTDNIADEDLSAIEGSFDNQAAPTSAIFEEFNGKVYYRDDAQKTDLLSSKSAKPWNVPYTNRDILDGPIQAMKRCYNVLVIGTDKGVWTIDTNSVLRRVSSTVGILNNSCLDGETNLYFVGTNKAFYSIEPTQLVQDNMTFGEPLSRLIGPIFNQISGAGIDEVCVKMLIKPDINKIMVSVPIGLSTNSAMLVFNVKQSIAQSHAVWQQWDNINASTLQVFKINDEYELVGGDYNGYIWKLHDDSMYGDGAELNGTSTGSNTNLTLNDTDQIDDSGTATSGTTLTLIDTAKLLDSGTATSAGTAYLTDSSKTWTVNIYVDKYVNVVGGTGSGQTRQIISNTSDTLTVSAWTTEPDATSVYEVSEWATNTLALSQVYIESGTGAGQYATVASNTSDTLTFTAAMALAPDATSVYSLGGWEIDGLKGINVSIVGGTGEGQTRLIDSNTDTEITVSTAWNETPDDTSEYTIGGYVAKNFSNWKKVLSSFEVLKQLWFMWVNANASGDYNIKMILQFDFDTSLNNQVETLISLKSENTIWGAFIWGLAIWGSRSVFLDRFRIYAKFNSVRVGFYHDLAGQPYQINNYAISAQDKGLYFKNSL